MATGNPTTAYRKQQGLPPITQSYDPKLVAMVVKAAKQTGADPVALLATAIQESGARLNGPPGDVASGYSSWGPFQMRETVGALGNRPTAWASTYEAVLNRAQEFKRLGVHHGKGAAAVQRPQDKVLYAQGVDSHAGQAAAILKKFGMGDDSGTTLPLPDGTASTVPAPGVATPVKPGLLPMVSVGPGAVGTGGGAGGVTGALTSGSFMEAALQTLGVKRHSSMLQGEARAPVTLTAQPKTSVEAKTLPLPDGSPSTVPNPTMMDAVAPGKPSKDWGGSKGVIQPFLALAKENGLGVMSEKRDRKLTTSGNPSDHWTGSTGSYAYDLSDGQKPTPAMDKTAAQIAASLGLGEQWKKQGNSGILNIVKNGYRYQMLYRTNQGGNHYNHVHFGVKKV